jgi:uncharacterized protein YxjI
MNKLDVDYFVIKRIAKARSKNVYDVSFECEGGIWTNEFELHMTKEDTVEKIKDKIIKRVRDMIKAKNEENELQVLVGEKITLNGSDEKEG